MSVAPGSLPDDDAASRLRLPAARALPPPPVDEAMASEGLDAVALALQSPQVPTCSQLAASLQIVIQHFDVVKNVLNRMEDWERGCLA